MFTFSVRRSGNCFLIDDKLTDMYEVKLAIEWACKYKVEQNMLFSIFCCTRTEEHLIGFVKASYCDDGKWTAEFEEFGGNTYHWWEWVEDVPIEEVPWSTER